MDKISQRTKNQLTNVAVKVGYSDNQHYHAEAQAFTDAFLAKFGIFVDLYNKLNNTTLSVENALLDEGIVNQFMLVKTVIAPHNTNSTPSVSKSQTKKSSGKPKSTKRLSYEQFQVENGTQVEHTIYSYLKQVGIPVTRSELAKALSIRLSTICGAINRMKTAGLVQIVGTKLDNESNRNVETIIFK